MEPGGRIVVDVRVNDSGPFRFAIDTAATSSFIFEKSRISLALTPLSGISATVHGAVATGSYPIVAVDRIEIGTESWRDIRLVALPGETDAAAGLDGVLGADFLRRYSLGFSASDNLVRLYRPEAIGQRAYRGWSEIRIAPRTLGESQEPLRFLELEIAGHEMPALFDLGAGVNVLNPPAARAMRLTSLETSREGELAGAIGNEPLIAQFSSQALRTGNVHWRNEQFLVADLEIFENLDSADRPLAILGSGLFRQRDFIIDTARDRLLIRATAETAASANAVEAATATELQRPLDP